VLNGLKDFPDTRKVKDDLENKIKVIQTKFNEIGVELWKSQNDHASIIKERDDANKCAKLMI
jgi:hypothetical protein